MADLETGTGTPQDRPLDNRTADANESPTQASSRNQNATRARLANSGSNSLLILIIASWQAVLISKYSKTFPHSILTGEHTQLNKSCSDLFWATDYSLLIAVFLILIDGTFVLVAFNPGLEDKLDGCIGLVRFFETVAGLLKLYVSIMGIFVIMGAKGSEIGDCYDLYYCAWWCFVGLLLLNALMGCCMIIFLAGLHLGRASAGAEGVSVNAAAPPMYGAVTGQPGQPQAEVVTPFTGHGHRLGDDPTETPTPTST
eukprot:TRINITY_DN2463_c0_g1_i1.p1 TRINITY_DN2463_c0_g1~~TRINITY_DN2463_c0_g1_i1.p1  ORF type:complete len:287 (-),score=31.44 TRINITY_DN2463_c0_g1_i1:118-885(-)